MYKDDIQNLIIKSPMEIDTEIQMSGRPPTMANSEFLTNREQGDWAEQIVCKAINEGIDNYFAIEYGRTESIAAGDDDFAQFYSDYQAELNSIGKRPDLLIFKDSDFPDKNVDIENDEHIRKATAALEIRSSSFLVDKYSAFMEKRQSNAIAECRRIREEITSGPLCDLLKQKNMTIYSLIKNATDDTFRELDFRRPSWSLTQGLRDLTERLKTLKDNIKILHKRDYLSITPKLEDIALVNRWIQNFDVKHYYLQVFFDKAYVISFQDILELVCNEDNEGRSFSIERDVKNQAKTTIKVNVQIGKEILGKIDMPEHKSAMKELDRGRLLFYVTFDGGKGYLDKEIFMRDIINA
ncbi:MAG: AccI family restriction endonuclease [Sedimentisphaerales bacterium]|nr:AccI family restriction endonuclease [Sedimentisphaerales bacterium]